MKRTVIMAMLLSLLLCGCTVGTLSPEKAAEKAAEQMSAGDKADKSGDLAGALEKYRAAEKLTPTDMNTIRAQIEVLKRMAAQDEQYNAQLTQAYEALYSADGFAEEDYIELAQLYIDGSAMAQARDVLEIGQCLAPSEAKAALLDTLTVDVSTDSSRVQEMLSPLLDKLNSGDRDGAVDYLLTEDVCAGLCSRVTSSSRRYFAKDGTGETRLLVSTDNVGAVSATLWHTASDGKLTVISVSPDTAFSGETFVKNGGYDGTFTAEYYKASNSSNVIDKGSFADGIATGTVTSEIYAGTEAAELKELWNARADVEKTSYTGELDETGHTTAKDASGLEDGQIAYAYTDGSTQYAYIISGGEDTAETFVFTPATFGFYPLPEW